MTTTRSCASEEQVNNGFSFVNNHLDQNAEANNASRERQYISSQQNADANANNLGSSVSRTSDKTQSEVESFGFQNLNATRGEGVETRSEVETFGFKNLGETQAASNRNESATEKFGLYNADKVGSYGLTNLLATKDSEKDMLLQASQNAAAAAIAACGNTSSIKENDNSNAKEIVLQAANQAAIAGLQAANNTSAIQDKVASGVCAIEVQAANNRAAIELDAAKNAAASVLQATLNAKDAEITAVTNAKDSIINANLNASNILSQMAINAKESMLTATINAKDAALTAAMNTAALQAKIAECCCENKALIIETSNRTDLLIQKLDDQRNRDALQREHEELVALRLRASLLPAPVAATAL